ncbi:MAG: VacJ family lipoprotein [Phycisphaerales bacterium]|nr:MAG: VacJ family lipoprotein [Phycisphaerales bacterium]
MRRQTLVVAILAVTTAGCAVSERTQPSGNVAETSANQQHVAVADDDMTPASDDPEETFADDEFDLLEDELDEQAVEIADPLESLNRAMYRVNDKLYLLVLEPGGRTYNRVTPELVRLGIRNFFSNVTTPVRLANCLLQGKGSAAGMEFQRFVVNTMTGVLGFADPARSSLGPPPDKEDLGQTLAVHGFGEGFYVVWPFFGPSTARDSVGMLTDLLLHPTWYVEPWQASFGASAVEYTNESSFHVGEYETFKSAALEPYVAMREAYIQYRDRQIQE